jgi:metallo-beta-lactamase class B
MGGGAALFGQDGAWTEPFPPHKIVGNVYYVGSRGLASYLISTPEGHILINSSLESSVPLIRASVEKLGLQFSDVKILLISHAHWDHCAGSAQVKELTGAKFMVMREDVAEMESGGKQDFHYRNYPPAHFKPVKVDRTLHDGDEVKLGGVSLTAHLTRGHTKGCTTWTMKVRDGARSYDVVVVGSVGMTGFNVANDTSAPGGSVPFRMVNNALYPGIADDFARAFRVLQSLACDVFLGAHGDYYGMERKFARIGPDGPNPLVDPQGYRDYVAQRERAFRAELNKQQP